MAVRDWKRPIRIRLAITLMELLVVIAIIAILVAMLLPAKYLSGQPASWGEGQRRERF